MTALASPEAYPIEALCADLEGITVTADPVQIRRKSQDRYAVSPLLRQILGDKRADVVVTPHTPR